MVKKLCVLAVLLGVFVGCEGTISSDTPYEEVIEKAYATDINRNNKNVNGYTFRAPSNAQVKQGSKFINSVVISNNSYSLYVNTTKYLEDEGLVVQTVNGEYVLATNDNSKRSDDMIFEYRRILLLDDPNITINENQENAQKVLQDLLATDNPSESFSEFAINYSSDIATSSNGGYIGPVNSSEIDNKTLAVLRRLDEKNVHRQLIAVDNGYEILMLEKQYQQEEEARIYEDTSDREYLFTTDDMEYQTAVIDNNDETYSVLTRNDHITVSTIVSESDINQAIYTTIVTARSIAINEDIVLHSLVNPSASTKAAEMFNLNSKTEPSDNTISTRHQHQFSTSLSANENRVNSNSFSFSTRLLTDEEIQALNEEKLKEESDDN